jgi:hypothetical protein
MRHKSARALVLMASIGVSALVTAQAQQRRVAVPAGTRLLIRMVDSVDSSKQNVG